MSHKTRRKLLWSVQTEINIKWRNLILLKQNSVMFYSSIFKTIFYGLSISARLYSIIVFIFIRGHVEEKYEKEYEN